MEFLEKMKNYMRLKEVQGWTVYLLEQNEMLSYTFDCEYLMVIINIYSPTNIFLEIYNPDFINDDHFVKELKMSCFDELTDYIEKEIIVS